MTKDQRDAFRQLIVLLSCVVFTLPPGVGGIILYSKLFALITGLGLHDPLPSIPYAVIFLVTPMLVFLVIGLSIGGMVWMVLMSLFLTEDDIRYLSNYPSPHIPFFTPAYEAFWEYLMKKRKEREARKHT
jgi:hypothetical protein